IGTTRSKCPLAAVVEPYRFDHRAQVALLRSFGRDAEHVLAVLRTLDQTASGVFADLEPAQRKAAAARLQESGGEPLIYLERIVLQCYYRDDRVMRSLGLEVRPPFPKGFEVEQG